MGRELKFRAWDGEQMFFWGFITDGVFYGPPSSSRKNLSTMVQMQYTGLLDKKGIEIYEGDIVRVIYINYADSPEKRYIDKEFIATVKYIDQKAYFGLCDIHMDDAGYPEPDVFNCRSVEYEVIGNLYQHPGLLR